MTVSNMAAIGVEVQDVCMRQAETMRIIMPTWHVQPSTPNCAFDTHKISRLRSRMMFADLGLMLAHRLQADHCCCTHDRGQLSCRWSALWRAGEVCCEPLTPLMPLLDMAQVSSATLASLVRLLKATAEVTLLLQQEHTKHLAGEGLTPTSAELQYGIPQALWGMRCDAAPGHLLSRPQVRLHNNCTSSLPAKHFLWRPGLPEHFMQVRLALVVPSAEHEAVLPFSCSLPAVPGQSRN